MRPTRQDLIRNTIYGTVIIVLWCVLLALVACGKNPPPAPAAEAPPPIACDETRLAARDLAGNCRATPQATMGALEAVS